MEVEGIEGTEGTEDTLFYFDDSCTIPLFTRPELLQHPNIPRGLAGVNPRTLIGQEWWDIERRLAYEQNNYCCWACGIHGTQDPFESRLEAHEAYEFNYPAKEARFVETVALCHSCHSFIHSGRLLALYRRLLVPLLKMSYIVTSRLALLREHDLEPFYFTLILERMVLYGETESQAYKAIAPAARRSSSKCWQLTIPLPSGEEVTIDGGE